jgi:hypothetical protein
MQAISNTIKQTASSFNAPNSKTSASIKGPRKAPVAAKVQNTTAPILNAAGPSARQVHVEFFKAMNETQKDQINRFKEQLASLKNRSAVLSNRIYELEFKLKFQMQQKAIAHGSQSHSRNTSYTQTEPASVPATAPQRAAVQQKIAPHQAQRPVSTPQKASIPQSKSAPNNSTATISSTILVASKDYAHSSTALMFRKIRNYNYSSALTAGVSISAPTYGSTTEATEDYSPGYISPELKMEAETTWEQFFMASTNEKKQHHLPMSPAQRHIYGFHNSNTWVQSYAQEKFNSFQKQQQTQKKTAPTWQNSDSPDREAARNVMLMKTSSVPVSYARKKMGSSTPSTIPLALYNKHNKSSCNGYEQEYFNAAMFELPPSFVMACQPAGPVHRQAQQNIQQRPASPLPNSVPVSMLASQKMASPTQQPNFHPVQLKKVPQSMPVHYTKPNNVAKPAPYASIQIMKDNALHNFGFAKSNSNNGYEEDYFNKEMFELPESYLSASHPAGPVHRMVQQKVKAATPSPTSPKKASKKVEPVEDQGIWGIFAGMIR